MTEHSSLIEVTRTRTRNFLHLAKMSGETYNAGKEHNVSRQKRLRTFVAVSIPCPISLARLLRELGQFGHALRCQSPRGLHCTLRFLGDTSAETADPLAEAIAEAVADVRRFSVEITGLGAFPNPDRPNVVWAGLQAPTLDDLFERIDAVASEFGYPSESRPFRPHVTLARVKGRPPPKLHPLLQEHSDTAWGKVAIDSVELYKSTLTPAGAQYEVLARCELHK